jgi:membrane fusion protein (multidrug efflux system)
MKAMLANARAEIQVAQVEQKRIRSLVSQNILSPSEEDVANSKLEAARAKAEEAAAQVAFAEIQLSYTRIKAPFNGVIDRIPLKQGSLAKEGDLLTTISDIKNVYAYFHISENEYLSIIKKDWIKNGEARLILSDGSIYPYTGKIESAESEIDEGTGSIALKAFFPNPEKMLKHGASGKLQIRIPAESLLLIPQKCIFEQQDKNYVYVADAQNTVRRRSVETGSRLGNLVIIKNGLSKDELLLYEGLQLVKEGQVIIPEILNNSGIY